jgi:phosphatidate cytidylyltransferase
VKGSVQLARWLTAAGLLALVVPVMMWGGRWSFLALVALAVLMCQWEFQPLTLRHLGIWQRVAEAVMALGVPAGAMFWGERGMLLAVVGLLLFWMAFDMLFNKEIGNAVRDLGARMLGYLYGAVLPSFFILTWRTELGIHWIFASFAIIFIGDTAAYYLGSWIGSTKLRPSISPHKTIEGSVAGLVGNVLGGMAYAIVFFPELLAPKGVLFSLVVGGIGQLGDLSESMLKRSVGVKDSSRILPGHGGVLDRLDSLLFAAPLIYYWSLRS